MLPFHFSHFLSVSILSVFLCFLSSPLSSSLNIPPKCEPSRDCVFFLLPLPAVFERLTADQGGIKVLIPKTCPSMVTPLPLAGHLQLNAARPPHPQITFQLSHREVTPHRQPHGVFDTHVFAARGQPPDLKLLG